MLLLMILSNIVGKATIDRKYADLMRDLMKFVLKESFYLSFFGNTIFYFLLTKNRLNLFKKLKPAWIY